jgi:hypothetical protein
MSNFAQSYGRDIRLDINLADGSVLTLPEIIDYDIKPTNHTDSFVNIQGRPVHNVIPQGGNLTINLKRVDSTIEDFQAAFEANYYAGAPLLKGTLTETISNPDGSIIQYQCQGVVLIIEDMGTWKGETAVSQQIKGMYETFVKIQ